MRQIRIVAIVKTRTSGKIPDGFFPLFFLGWLVFVIEGTFSLDILLGLDSGTMEDERVVDSIGLVRLSIS